MKNLNHELTEQELKSIAGGFRALNFSQRSFKLQAPRLLQSTKLNVAPKASIWQDMMNWSRRASLTHQKRKGLVTTCGWSLSSAPPYCTDSCTTTPNQLPLAPSGNLQLRRTPIRLSNLVFADVIKQTELQHSSICDQNHTAHWAWSSSSLKTQAILKQSNSGQATST